MAIDRLITRRRAIALGLASVGGFAFARAPRELPPTYGHLLRMADNVTYAAHRAFLPGQSLVKEYAASDITSFPATGTTDPAMSLKTPLGDRYRRSLSSGFSDWQLALEGLVSRPRTFSLAELKGLPSRTQITRHTCEEGWTAIGQWTGVPLSFVLQAAGLNPSARFLVFHSYDDWVACIDMVDALHPQTILAYAMNGRELPVPHGAPVRLRVERQMGYKSMKYVHRIVATDRFEDGGVNGDIRNGWAWYTGI